MHPAYSLRLKAYSLQLKANSQQPIANSLFKKNVKTFSTNATFISLASFHRYILASHREFGFG
jgi:hypothetical protein